MGVPLYVICHSSLVAFNILSLSLSFVSSVQALSCVRLFATPWTAARRASLSVTNSRSPPKPMSIESVMPSNHLVLCCPLLLLPAIFPSIRVFSNLSVQLLCVSVYSFWGLSCLELSVLPGLGWLFPFPCKGSFQLLSLHIFSWVFLSLFSFWCLSNSNVGAFNVVPEAS